MEEIKRVLIAEDHKVLRAGLRSMIDTSDDLMVVGEAGDGMEAIRYTLELEPDLLLLDLNMPKMDGISVIKEISRRFPDTKILVLTMFKQDEYVLEAFKSGIHGYCVKTSSYEELMIAVRAVLSGKIYISPEISHKVMSGYLDSTKTANQGTAWGNITSREREVLKLVGEGFQNKEIADYLCISPKTVEKHRANIMQKLDLHSASALTSFAIEKGLVLK